jgi:hypothetical protein
MPHFSRCPAGRRSQLGSKQHGVTAARDPATGRRLLTAKRSKLGSRVAESEFGNVAEWPTTSYLVDDGPRWPRGDQVPVIRSVACGKTVVGFGCAGSAWSHRPVRISKVDVVRGAGTLRSATQTGFRELSLGDRRSRRAARRATSPRAAAVSVERETMLIRSAHARAARHRCGDGPVTAHGYVDDLVCVRPRNSLTNTPHGRLLGVVAIHEPNESISAEPAKPASAGPGSGRDFAGGAETPVIANGPAIALANSHGNVRTLRSRGRLEFPTRRGTRLAQAARLLVRLGCRHPARS